jgi:hypothetical protein
VTRSRKRDGSPTVATHNAFFKAMTSAHPEVARHGLAGTVAVLGLTLLAVLFCAPGLGAQAPDEAWRTLDTKHFRVTFPQGLEALGRRAGDRAEHAWDELSGGFVKAPSGKIDILLTDHTDVTNGFAQVTPSNRITVFARPPVDDPGLGYFDDWMELVITHELVHIFHLDETGTLGRGLRPVFGRVPIPWPIFPDLGLPRWTTEGVATWYESRFTGAGRTKGTFEEMQLRTAVLEHRFENLGQASGDSPVWPAGNRPYAYGSLFFRYLLDKHGEEAMGAFARAVAGQWVPYRLDAAARHAFGSSISDEWSAWTDSLEGAYAHLDDVLGAQGPVTRLQRLTDGARYGQGARVSPDGSRLAFVWADGRSDTQIRVSAPDGSASRELARSNSIPTFDYAPNGDLVVAQLELKDPYRTYADLYVVTPDGTQRRLTRNARLDYPSVAPDGKWVVAVQEGSGTSGLVRVDLETGEVTSLRTPELDVHWTMPRVSPDGKWIAVTRWTPGAFTDVVVLDTQGRERLVLTHDRAMDLAPAWTSDGKTLLWASDRTGIENILAADVDPGTGMVGPIRMVTNVETGVGYPTVDPSGRWLYVGAYHANGWDVERMPLSPSTWIAAPAVASRFDAPPRSTEMQSARAEGDVRDYSAVATLRPYYWEPLYWAPVRTSAIHSQDLDLRSRQVLGPAVGVQTSGRDLVGRHAFTATARVFTDGNRADGSASYSYSGLGNPVLSFGVSQYWDEDGVRLGQRADTLPLDTLFAVLRERAVGASVTLLHPRWREAYSVALGGSLIWQHRDLLDNDLQTSRDYRLLRPDARLGDLRVTMQYTTARTHAFQIGQAQGFSMLVRARARRELSLPDSLAGRAGRDRGVDEVIGQVRAFRLLGGPGFAAHVVGLRGSFGYANGPGADAGWFEVGGASGSSETLTGLSLFGGTPLLFAVRGYPETTRSGRLAWSGSFEYRFPLLLVNRGLGAWPLNLDRTMGTLFADAGNAWGPELGIAGFQNSQRSALASVGAEVTADLLTFWTVPMTVRVGGAVPLVEGNGVGFYVRLGVSF